MTRLLTIVTFDMTPLFSFSFFYSCFTKVIIKSIYLWIKVLISLNSPFSNIACIREEKVESNCFNLIKLIGLQCDREEFMDIELSPEGRGVKKLICYINMINLVVDTQQYKYKRRDRPNIHQVNMIHLLTQYNSDFRHLSIFHELNLSFLVKSTLVS